MFLSIDKVAMFLDYLICLSSLSIYIYYFYALYKSHSQNHAYMT